MSEQKLLSRCDVQKLIEKHGGKAEGLDLSGEYFEKGINLSGLDLRGIILGTFIPSKFELKDFPRILKSAQFDESKRKAANLREANLNGANLEGAKLVGVNLKKAELVGTHLEGAELYYAKLEEANLSNAFLEKAILWGANLHGVYMFPTKSLKDTNLESIDWASELVLREEKDGDFDYAADTYRKLKQWYTDAGMLEEAGKFYYLMMEARRNGSRRSSKWNWFLLSCFRFLCGYGEEPWRVVASAAVVILGLALIYLAVGTLQPNSFLDCLYYSFVSFTAVGYGAWVKESAGLVKWLGVMETIFGVFTMALFLVTFTRKMTR